jgi:hypothetical protein
MDSHFLVQKMVQDEQFLSSLESGLRFLTDRHFPVWKMVQIDSHFHNENGLIDCLCTIDSDSPCGQWGGMVWDRHSSWQSL